MAKHAEYVKKGNRKETKHRHRELVGVKQPFLNYLQLFLSLNLQSHIIH